MAVFDESVITPNDAFFVRYHLTVAPPQSLYLDPDTYKFEVKGKVNTPLTISLNDLKTQFEPVELIARQSEHRAAELLPPSCLSCSSMPSPAQP